MRNVARPVNADQVTNGSTHPGQRRSASWTAQERVLDSAGARPGQREAHPGMPIDSVVAQ